MQQLVATFPCLNIVARATTNLLSPKLYRSSFRLTLEPLRAKTTAGQAVARHGRPKSCAKFVFATCSWKELIPLTVSGIKLSALTHDPVVRSNFHQFLFKLLTCLTSSRSPTKQPKPILGISKCNLLRADQAPVIGSNYTITIWFNYRGRGPQATPGPPAELAGPAKLHLTKKERLSLTPGLISPRG